MNDYRGEISQTMLVDQYPLKKTLSKLGSVYKKEGESEKFISQQKRFLERVKSSQEQRAFRKISRPVCYPVDLPISDHVEEIKRCLSKHQVLILAGETGSGKSTQIPKVCFELGLSEAGMIAHTQPRRIAAKTLSQRVSEELKKDLGQACPEAMVACKVRFSDSVRDNTHIKYMTDGMLLAEIESDPYLEQYQCIILDEVHERSLNIDFLIAYVKRLLLKRKDLKLILTSATIELEKLSRHFGDAPMIEVSGRSYPVEIFYVSAANEEEGEDSEQSLMLSALETILSRSPTQSIAQDILVFLATEKDIRFYSKFLKKHFSDRLEVFPLYGRLPLEQQKKVFSTASRRRIILATNVAETSITVPNIGFVIDQGLARISRYRVNTKVQALPIEKISQASASQRAGRCGRIAPGQCYRLYSEQDFESREVFTEPEIKRTELSSVLLKMASLKLGDIERFSLPDPPEKKMVRQSRKYLQELQAFDQKNRLQSLGREMARFSLEPAFARILLEASTRSCLAETLIILTALTTNDPRMRPADKQQQADNSHKAYFDSRSDFISLLKLWDVIENKRFELSHNKFRKYCQENFLSFTTIQEWRDVHRQLMFQLKQQGMPVNTLETRCWFADDDSISRNEDLKSVRQQKYMDIHKSLLKGWYSNVAMKLDTGNYQGANHKQVFVFPGSNLFKQKYKWIVSAQLIETTRLFAHYCAEIDPSWLIEQTDHLLSRQYLEPFWSKKAGSVQVYQKTSFRGLVLEAKKRVKARPEMSGLDENVLQTLFIQGALIARQYYKPPQVLQRNWAILDELQTLENKTRGEFLAPQDNELQEYYASKIRSPIYDTRSFEKCLSQDVEQTFLLNKEELMKSGRTDSVASNYPDFVEFDGLKLACEYVFKPGEEKDGLVFALPYAQFNQLSPSKLEWLVPGLLNDKCTALLRSLPKSRRKQLLPLEETVARTLERINFAEGDLLDSLISSVHAVKGVSLDKHEFDLERLPDFLRPSLRVFDEKGKTLVKQSSYDSAKKAIQGLQLKTVSRETTVPAKIYTKWDFGNIAPTFVTQKKMGSQSGHYEIRKFNALVDKGEGVAILALDNQDEAEAKHRYGQLKLLYMHLSASRRDLEKAFHQEKNISVKLFTAGDEKSLFDDLFKKLIEHVFFREPSTSTLNHKLRLIFSQEEFFACIENKRSHLYPEALVLFDLLGKLSQQVFELRQELAKPVSELRLKHHQMVEAHLEYLISPAFLFRQSHPMLLRYPLYLKAMKIRLQSLQGRIDEDARKEQLLSGFRKAIHELEVKCAGKSGENELLLAELVYMLEEFQMHSFAQNIKPAMPVSEKRLRKAIESLERAL